MTGPYRAILYKEVYYMNTFTLKGTFLDTPAPDTLRVREGYLLCENGLCAGFSETAPAGVEVLDYTGKSSRRVLWTCICTRRSTAIAARAMDLELLDWLQQYTYPEEAHYADPAYARLGYSYFVRDLKNSATTRACIFATLHTDATLELMRPAGAARGFPPLSASWVWTATALTATVSRPPPRVWPRRAAGWIPATPKTPCTRARCAR